MLWHHQAHVEPALNLLLPLTDLYSDGGTGGAKGECVPQDFTPDKEARPSIKRFCKY